MYNKNASIILRFLKIVSSPLPPFLTLPLKNQNILT
jgi:hypothetical protein